MKKQFITAMLLILSFNSFAGASRGYIIQNQGDIFYTGLNDKNGSVSYGIDFFSDESIKVMYDCMEDKGGYAILVDTKDNPSIVTDKNDGNFKLINEPEVVDVDCVKAPRFINHWRSIFND
jgi:hypothetical protein